MDRRSTQEKSNRTSGDVGIFIRRVRWICDFLRTSRKK
jgi:hypothetical protein